MCKHPVRGVCVFIYIYFYYSTTILFSKRSFSAIALILNDLHFLILFARSDFYFHAIPTKRIFVVERLDSIPRITVIW